MATISKVRSRARSAVETLSSQSLGTVTHGLRKVALAGVGAFAVAGEKARTQVKSQWKVLNGSLDKLAVRGDEAQKNGRKVVKTFLQGRVQEVRKGAGSVGDRVEHQVGNMLGKLNVPTKSDIVELTRRIDALSRKIDRM